MKKYYSKEEEITIKMATFEALAATTSTYGFNELVRLLKEVAEFRITNDIEDKDKVLIVIPYNYINKGMYEPLLRKDIEERDE